MAHNDCKPLPPFTEKDIIRFWSKVDACAQDECWPWKGTIGTWGYAYFTVCRSSKTNNLKSSRVAYFLHFGEDPYPMFVLHTCDNHACCNPHHLFKGTQAENIADMMAKGRSSAGKKRPPGVYKGEGNGRAKLTDVQIKEIRQLLDNGLRMHQIAIWYGVKHQAISKIRLRQRWAHVS